MVKNYPLPILHPYSFGSASIPYLSKSRVTANQLPDFFDDWNCTGDLRSIKKVLSFAADKMQGNFFGLIKIGETHFPYDYYEESFPEFLDKVDGGKFELQDAQERQIKACEKAIGELNEFRSNIPKGTQVILTSDHGELFGEQGGVGHNPNQRACFHEKLFEVPLLHWIE